jgi:hypothetical protein
MLQSTLLRGIDKSLLGEDPDIKQKATSDLFMLPYVNIK